MLAIFFKSLLIAFSGAVMPGSVFTYTVDRSLRHGVKAGVLVSLGHALRELILVILIFVGAGRYLAAESAGIAIGLIGGVVLVYLGSQMLKDVYLNKITLETGEMHDHKQGGMFMAGMVLSATNPYFLIWWSAVGLALIMSAYHSLGVWGIVIFYLGHILGDITWYTLWRRWSARAGICSTLPYTRPSSWFWPCVWSVSAPVFLPAASSILYNKRTRLYKV
jgi:threonine/homoserine/homoserine lactone efflux protein